MIMFAPSHNFTQEINISETKYRYINSADRKTTVRSMKIGFPLSPI